MDGSFACPECGSEVEVAGLAPGRQVRCGFCHRLLEVPYLPRIPAAGWKRRRFGHLRWVRWAWASLGAILVVALTAGMVRFLGQQYQSLREGSIHKLLASSRANETNGRLDLALLDLDAAIDLARRSGETVRFPMEEQRQHRTDLVRREVEGVLGALDRQALEPYPLPDWLNLVARAAKDPDLASLEPRIEKTFRESLRGQTANELRAARRELEAGRVVASLRACDRVAGLLPHMAADDATSARAEAEALVARLVESHGVALETPRGEFVLGSQESYRSELLPALVDALEARGYLPYRESSPWRSAWRKALYSLRLEVSEQLMGNYLSSDNRLTRIEARLMLAKQSSGEVVWRTTPTARTIVPVPGLPAYVSSRAAASRERSPQFERLLYDNARGQVNEKFAHALSNMPTCCR